MSDTVQIQNGSSGGGNGARVNASDELVVNAAAEALRANVDGRCYSALVDVTSATTDDDFFYLLNSDPRDLVVFKIQGWCDDAEQEISVLIGATDAGTAAGDTITPRSLNSSAGTALVTCTSDATDLAITGGNGVDLLKFHATALGLGSWDYSAGIILKNGARMHMQAALAGLINLTVFFYFREDD